MMMAIGFLPLAVPAARITFGVAQWFCYIHVGDCFSELDIPYLHPNRFLKVGSFWGKRKVEYGSYAFKVFVKLLNTSRKDTLIFRVSFRYFVRFIWKRNGN